MGLEHELGVRSVHWMRENDLRLKSEPSIDWERLMAQKLPAANSATSLFDQEYPLFSG